MGFLDLFRRKNGGEGESKKPEPNKLKKPNKGKHEARQVGLNENAHHVPAPHSQATDVSIHAITASNQKAFNQAGRTLREEIKRARKGAKSKVSPMHVSKTSPSQPHPSTRSIDRRLPEEHREIFRATRDRRNFRRKPVPATAKPLPPLPQLQESVGRKVQLGHASPIESSWAVIESDPPLPQARTYVPPRNQVGGNGASQLYRNNARRAANVQRRVEEPDPWADPIVPNPFIQGRSDPFSRLTSTNGPRVVEEPDPWADPFVQNPFSQGQSNPYSRHAAPFQAPNSMVQHTRVSPAVQVAAYEGRPRAGPTARDPAVNQGQHRLHEPFDAPYYRPTRSADRTATYGRGIPHMPGSDQDAPWRHEQRDYDDYYYGDDGLEIDDN